MGARRRCAIRPSGSPPQPASKSCQAPRRGPATTMTGCPYGGSATRRGGGRWARGRPVSRARSPMRSPSIALTVATDKDAVMPAPLWRPSPRGRRPCCGRAAARAGQAPAGRVAASRRGREGSAASPAAPPALAAAPAAEQRHRPRRGVPWAGAEPSATDWGGGAGRAPPVGERVGCTVASSCEAAGRGAVVREAGGALFLRRASCFRVAFPRPVPRAPGGFVSGDAGGARGRAARRHHASAPTSARRLMAHTRVRPPTRTIRRRPAFRWR